MRAMRALIFFGLSLLATGAFAQQPLAEPQPAAEGRKNQKVERIVLEDSGSRVEEVRYAGQSQSITVQPRAGMPEYEIQPTDGARSRPADRDGLSTATGQRVWNLLKF